ncbi:MAG: PSD1 and planctomycete cytochrome C domain-containing protein [Bacteroidota bacterium]
MSSLHTTTGILGICVLLIGACNPSPTARVQVDPEALFVHEIKPLLTQKCLACHGDPSNELKGEFDMRSWEGLVSGGESGKAAVIPGEATKSPLYLAVTREDPDFAMPPKENDKLTSRQMKLLKTWIDAGAPWPDSVKQAAILAADDWEYSDGVQVPTSGGLNESWTQRRYKEEDLWAYQPLREVEVPKSAPHPIDAFINQRLKEVGLKPARAAKKGALIRRMSFDLLGLPPTPKEFGAFSENSSKEAYEEQLERMLASPQYGEQWGRHWLDVARYADSDGFSNDYARPNAWRYRDYVIRAFNDDKPYDQFIREQLAGDEIDPEDPEMLIATGFLRMGPWEHTGMSVAAETRQYFLDDVTNSVGETFFATPLRCARCHDHKFDPIPTRDYYKIQAVFASTQFAQREATFLPEENAPVEESEMRDLQDWIEQAQEERRQINEKEEEAARAWYAAQGKKYKPKRKRSRDPEGQKPSRYLGLSFQELGYRKYLNKRMQTLTRELDRYEPWAYAVYNGPTRIVHSARENRMPESIEDPIDTIHILRGGSVYAPIDPVEPGVLSMVSPEFREVPRSSFGRRLAFANWLTQENKALTARTMVNRIWQYHFGQGLAGNPNNLGITGKKPTHPELLDWLAQYFIDNNWSVKALHRLIMTSDAYKRATQYPNPNRLARLDPNKELYAVFQPRRLDAEEIRDAMLAVSGELNLERGGIPVRPIINLEVALQPRHIMGSVARAYQPSRSPEQRNRRTIYTERKRSIPDPLLAVFNQPQPDLSCERRSTSTVTPQVFTLFNGTNTYDRALAMAVRLEEEVLEPEKQIFLAMELTWNRQGTPAELAATVSYLQEMTQYHQENPPPRKEFPTKVTRHMFEEMTGEPFEFEEVLEVYAELEPDIQARELRPETLALADVCKVLFNSNEFLYVY